MENLFEKSFRKVDGIKYSYQRNFISKLNQKDRLIGLKGARGVGKTTLLLQYMKHYLPGGKKTIYVSLDDLYFATTTLVEFVDLFVKQGGQFLILDEVHRYKNWSQEIKNIYDDHADLKIIYTGSSILHLHTAKADLSRRAVMYELPGLSFREYLEIKNGDKHSVFTLPEIINDHTEIARKTAKKIRPLAEFNDYLLHGYYPYFLESLDTYHMKVSETINLILEMDLPYFQELSYSTVDKLRQLLSIIAASVPFKPNVAKLSEKIGSTRNSLKDNINYLDSARIINTLYSSAKGISALQKPDKIYLHNTNLSFALKSTEPDRGNLRETFFMNQLAFQNDVTYPASGDFMVNEKYVFEVGGKNKSKDQIKDVKNSFLALDGIEIGVGDKIPLWLFGFLY